MKDGFYTELDKKVGHVIYMKVRVKHRFRDDTNSVIKKKNVLLFDERELRLRRLRGFCM